MKNDQHIFFSTYDAQSVAVFDLHSPTIHLHISLLSHTNIRIRHELVLSLTQLSGNVDALRIYDSSGAQLAEWNFSTNPNIISFLKRNYYF